MEKDLVQGITTGFIQTVNNVQSVYVKKNGALVLASDEQIKNLTDIEVMPGENHLRAGILRNRDNVKKITLCDGLADIHEGAVCNTGISEIIFKPGLGTLSAYSVSHNKDLKHVEFSEAPNRVIISPRAFEKSNEFDVFVNGKKCGPENVYARQCKNTHLCVHGETITMNAYDNMPNLEMVYVANPKCRAIGDISFKNCPRLKTAQIGDIKYQIEHFGDLSLIRISDIKKKHGASQAIFKGIGGKECFVTWVDNVFAIDSSPEMSFQSFMARKLSARHGEILESLKGIKPTDKVSIEPTSYQQMYCTEMARMTHGSGCLTNFRKFIPEMSKENSPLYMDCDECKKKYVKIYKACMKSIGLIKQKSKTKGE